VVLLCGFSVTAYAGGGDEYIEETTPPEQTGGVNWEGLDPVEPGEGFSEDGTLVTRDLLYDKHTNKQFITVQTKGGSTFYIVIDYDKPVNEEEEQYQTYFLNTVDEADLLAAIEAAGGELPECACTEKCAAGAVNTDCPVCATNMTECAGVAPEPEPDPEPVEEPEPEKKGGGMGTLLLVLAVLAIGGGAGWYFKIYRPKKEQAADPAEEEYDGEDYGDPYGGDESGDYGDDAPPWDEEDEA
ncbi:MAG: DUF4366 domain-containing protein, partial [Clostridia bacterium]|nr:DUF4366 domain-containing protein [Clostridia bacterium]